MAKDAMTTATDSGIWLRLALLDEVCTVRLESFHAPETEQFRWRMTIARRDGSELAIIMEADTAVDALTRALARAETLEWFPKK